MMNPSPRKKNYSAFAWALFSQSIWLPALVVDTQDRLTSFADKYSPSTRNASQAFSGEFLVKPGTEPLQGSGFSIAKNSLKANSSGILLNAIVPSSNQKVISEPSLTSGSLNQSPTSVFSAPPAPRSLEVSLRLGSDHISKTYPLTATLLHSQSSQDPLRNIYSKSDLLGGTLSLQDLNEPDMPPIARAERLHWIRSGDPLAPIPNQWRESMRKALSSLSNPDHTAHSRNASNPKEQLAINSARIIHVPSSKIKRSAEIPLALQSDGTVDILNSPDDPAVVEEIKNWSSKQEPPVKGRMTPAIVHLHPLPAVPSPHTANSEVKSITRMQAAPVSVSASDSQPSTDPPTSQPPPPVPAPQSASIAPADANQNITSEHVPALNDSASAAFAGEVAP